MKEQYADKYLQLGLKIAYYRKLRGLTQEQLAEELGRSPAFIGHVEAPNINKAISLDTLFGIAEVLDVPGAEFYTMEEYHQDDIPTLYLCPLRHRRCRAYRVQWTGLLPGLPGRPDTCLHRVRDAFSAQQKLQ